MNQFYFHQVIVEKLSTRVTLNRRYSLRGFARHLGVSPSALSEILNSKRVPSYQLSMKLVRGLGLSSAQIRLFLESVAEAQRMQPNRKRVDKMFKSRKILNTEALELLIEFSRQQQMKVQLTFGDENIDNNNDAKTLTFEIDPHKPETLEGAEMFAQNLEEFSRK